MKITIEVPDEMIDEAIRSARIDWCKDFDRHAGTFVADITCHDDSEPYYINARTIAAGLVTMAQGKKTARHFADLMAGTGDSITGDVLIQCAAFGELRYG